ncbi:hypothetical protein EJ05DRAFT_463937 [Pseudovirgaria hyperparasitica]|uniref:Peptidyl-prolyl cis-trans isomerase-like 1 n=1 Tax=Pseudovirgaria hyperparasitica TaxID=470096 RepID=A0A6A6WCL8_9PEZI|nr:uncharacterized protein EJ05DRAFT_463937 [Pseudovirgaria hyperparasitica]KAF2759317.1 hypothetical protein EJ05DRAFT_463937 [Pseudovirgaria hyperparasitica]
MADSQTVGSATPKRSRDEFEKDGAVTNPGDDDDASSSDDDDDFGPAPLAATAPPKKKRKLPYQKLYVAALPSSARYSRSLMHRDQLSFLTLTPHSDFLITSSVDGIVKFWKKTPGALEFVKEFRSHVGEIRAVSVSVDGRSYATCGADRSVKIFDVATFDLLAMLKLEYVPGCVCWVHGGKGARFPLLAVADAESAVVRIYDGRGENLEPLHVIGSLHRKPVTLMAYNKEYDCVVSADEGGMLEYWRPSGSYEKPESVWQMKSATNLFEFKKAKAVPTSLTISPTGTQFATFSFPDRKVRVFDFATGKLLRTYDESIQTIEEMQQAGTAAARIDDIEFARRIAVERDLDQPAVRTRLNVVFDETGHFILYGSLYGVKVVNTLTNRVMKLYGKDEPFRALNLALYQGQPDKKAVVTVEMAASENPLLQEAEARDAMLAATGAGKVRFYMFTNVSEITKSTRDIQNEKPTPQSALSLSLSKLPTTQPPQTGTTAILHTTLGDITLLLNPLAAPLAVENFTTHARNTYYNNTPFHRIIPKFMIQTGDPLGDGTGGESIWAGPPHNKPYFRDEIALDVLRHDRPYTVSMANSGPDSNGSQFFITTGKAEWLDGKHTAFGRAVAGLDVVHRIEGVRCWRERPEVDVRIVDVEIL